VNEGPSLLTLKGEGTAWVHAFRFSLTFSPLHLTSSPFYILLIHPFTHSLIRAYIP